MAFFRDAVDLAAFRHDRLERVDDIGLEWLIGQIHQVLRRVEGVEQGARVVAKHITHLGGRQLSLDKVVALAAARVRFDVDLYVRVLGLERLLQPLGGRDVGGLRRYSRSRDRIRGQDRDGKWCAQGKASGDQQGRALDGWKRHSRPPFPGRGGRTVSLRAAQPPHLLIRNVTVCVPGSSRLRASSLPLGFESGLPLTAAST